MKASVTLRLNQADYNKIKKVFPAERGETMASYFNRLRTWLEGRPCEDCG